MRYPQVFAALALVVIATPRSGLAAPEPTIWLGGGLGLSPVGTLKANSNSFDAATAFGINGLLEFRVTPNVSIELAPTLLFNVKSRNEESSNELDLPLRLAVGAPVAPAVRLYGFVAPGYSIFFPGDTPSVDLGHPSGFMLGFGGGAGFRIAPSVMVTTELGYQFRWLSGTGRTSIGGVDFSADYSLDANYLTLGLGIVAGLD
jgi:hypothetical protein